MRVLSLFSGIGAHDYGLELAGFEIVGQVEIDEYCRKVLTKHWANVPRWADIRAVTAADIRAQCGHVDLITGGFPCQDISTAGKQAGLDGERSGLWWEMRRLIRDLRPDWLLIENVPALRTKGADRVFSALEELGYTGEALVVGAIHAGAPHIRKRMWYVGNCQGERQREPNLPRNTDTENRAAWQISSGAGTIYDTDGTRYTGGVSGRDEAQESATADANRTDDVPDADRDRVWQQSGREQSRRFNTSIFTFPAGPNEPQHEWEEPRTIESPVGATAPGSAERLANRRMKQELRGIGNANPPAIPYLLGLAIKQLEDK